MFVTKFDGRKEIFQKEKIIRTCLRMRATREQAEYVAEKIETKAYDGIPTKKILELIFFYLKKFRPEISYHIDLRKSISLLRPKPDFEIFVQLLLKALGYEVIPNQIVRGICVEHEIDAIAKMGKETIFVEVKHHLNPHTYTGVDVCLETFARMEDLREGYLKGINKIKFDYALIVCNTKFSEYAKNYSLCKNIKLLGWNFPEGRGLEQIIIEKKLYPITFLKELDPDTEKKIADSGIVLLKQMAEIGLNELYKRTGVSKSKINRFREKAIQILD
ncbi:MAG: restriction endonuclease [Candidatus Aenigmatarchaeota archaeon]